MLGNFLTKVFDFARSDKKRGSDCEQEGWDALRRRNTVTGKDKKLHKKREEKQVKIWNHEVNRMKKGQAGSNGEIQPLNRPVFTKGASQKEKYH